MEALLKSLSTLGPCAIPPWDLNGTDSPGSYRVLGLPSQASASHGGPEARKNFVLGLHRPAEGSTGQHLQVTPWAWEEPTIGSALEGRSVRVWEPV